MIVRGVVRDGTDDHAGGDGDREYEHAAAPGRVVNAALDECGACGALEYTAGLENVSQ